MEIKHKSADLIEVKTDAESGTFSATVAIFHNVDRGGDRILPGAFDATLKQWRDQGDPIPIILSHDWNNPWSHIGYVDPHDLEPTGKGLLVKKGILDIGDNDVARQVHKLMKRRSLREFSFGYTVPSGGERRTKEGVNELSALNLVEVGPTLKGMNPKTELHGVKSAIEQQAKQAKPTAHILRQRATLIERAATEDTFPELGPPPPPAPATVLPDAPDVDQLRKTAAAVAREYDREQAARQRAADEARIPAVPSPPTPESMAAPSAAPDSESLRARAHAIEGEQAVQSAARRRAAEEAAIPSLGPAPVPTSTPIAPSADELRQRTAALDAEIEVSQASRARAAEEASIPEVAPAPVSQAPPIAPDAVELRQRARALEAEMIAEHQTHSRASEEAAIPEVGPSPPVPVAQVGPIVPDPVALRAAALRIEGEEAGRSKAARREGEEATIPELGPVPMSAQIQAPTPMDHQALKALADLIEGQIGGIGVRDRRAREEAVIPDLGPAPMSATTPMPKFSPETLRAMADDLERQQTGEQALKVKAAEQALITGIDPGPAAPVPIPAAAPVAMDPVTLRVKARELEDSYVVQSRQDLRAAEEALLPEVPPVPTPSFERQPPSAAALWAKAQRLEAEYEAETASFNQHRDERMIEETYDDARLKGITIDGDKATVVRNYQAVSPENKARLHGLIEHYRKSPHPFTQCVTDNRKRFGDRAERVCAVLKDIMENTTSWRGHEKGLPEFKDAQFERLHPRGHGGKFGHKPGLRDTKIPRLGSVAPGEPGSKGNPIDVGGDIDKAAKLLGEGKHVKLHQPRQVAILADKLADIVNQAKAKGDKAPNFDLCHVTVPGTNLFCVGNKGVPRIQMPQLKGVPVPGTTAAGMPADERGEVEVTKQFAASLKKKGVKLTEGSEKSVFLRPTQMEINGGKVGGMKKFLDGGGVFGGDPRFFVSRDNYILDGHHRWAALTAYDLEDNKPGDISVPIVRVDMDIADLLDEANAFAAKLGIPQADVSQMPDKIVKGISYGSGVSAPMVVSPPAAGNEQHTDAQREENVRRLLDELDGDDEAEAIIAYLESCLEQQPKMDAATLRAKADLIEREMTRAEEESRIPLVPQDTTDNAMKSYMRGVRNSYELAEVMDGRTIYEDGSVMHVRAITSDEHEGVKDGLVKAVWTAAYVNNLPDSAVLYVAPGGSKDSEGKTMPRANRYFPVRDADGNVDIPHLRNALARIPQSNLSTEVKQRCVNSAQRLLSEVGKNLSIPDGTDKETYGSRSVDPLRERAEEVALEFVSGGMSSVKPPKSTGPTQPTSTPQVPMRDLREQMRESALSLFIEE